jgi:hypothetical protein
VLKIAQIYHVLNLELKKKTVKSPEYYGEGSRKLSIYFMLDYDINAAY